MTDHDSKVPCTNPVLARTRSRHVACLSTLTLTLAVVACTSAVEPAPARVATLERLTPENPTGVVATEITPAPAVLVRDQHGVPLPGIRVEWAATGGGTVINSSTLTNAEGVASAGEWRLGWRAGPQALFARSAGLAHMSFNVAALPGPVATIRPVDGNNQFGLSRSALAKPLWVELTDAYSNRIAGASVIFSVVGGDGTITGDAAVTSSLGIAISGVWTLGSGGPQKVSARSDTVAVVFDAMACATIAWGCDQPISTASAIVFARGGNLFHTAVENAQPVQITSGNFDGNPAWSPDGSRVAFERYDGKGRTDIWIIGAGGELTRRTTDWSYSTPAWSVDGRKLAVTRYEPGQGAAIFVMSVEADGKPPLRLTEGSNPTWSPDGARLACTKIGSIVSINADGTGLTTLAPADNRWFDDAAWSPDGRSLAFTVYSNCDWDDNCDTAIGVLDPGATEVRLVVRGARGRSYAGQPAWSPDGSTIAYTSCCPLAVSAVKVDGTSARVVVADGASPTWRR